MSSRTLSLLIVAFSFSVNCFSQRKKDLPTLHTDMFGSFPPWSQDGISYESAMNWADSLSQTSDSVKYIVRVIEGGDSYVYLERIMDRYFVQQIAIFFEEDTYKFKELNVDFSEANNIYADLSDFDEWRKDFRMKSLRKKWEWRRRYFILSAETLRELEGKDFDGISIMSDLSSIVSSYYLNNRSYRLILAYHETSIVSNKKVPKISFYIKRL